MSIKDTRIIFDKDFYVLQAIFHSKKFKREEKKILKRLTDIRCLLPKTRFSRVKDYHRWVEKLHKRGVTHYSFVKKILSDFGVNSNNDIYQSGLVLKIFFNKSYAPIKFTSMLKWERDKDPEELWVRIYPWTKKEDLEISWPEIVIAQKELSGYRGKEKPWENFKRDLEIYTLFQKVQKDISNGIYKYKDPERKKPSKSPYAQLPHYDEFFKIEEKYRKTNKKGDLQDKLPTIISRCKKNFGSLQLL